MLLEAMSPHLVGEGLPADASPSQCLSRSPPSNPSFSLHFTHTQACRIGNWSVIGRLKRMQHPRLPSSLSFSSTGASPPLLQAMAGRLLVDTSVSARELATKEVSFSLSALALSLLGQHRTEVQAGEVAGAYGSAEALMKLVRGGEGRGGRGVRVGWKGNVERGGSLR